ncbi:DUF2207 domain-containing protein [Sporosarcina sp. HYO08]|uniref:DUF2207 domain-containing protein n=1 Tax=Sporosarcina sp. HYO08 TaxID=1759557 RepID=UPI00079ADAA4|nr:DUF2207 domain-containing protein [Sporosarcina sp. HYO08]KXH80865.1 hypothetical protein AU377_09035 [Sporosarcina sp. HYO08]
MIWRKIIPLMLMLILLLPIQTLAVDFTIKEVTIDAYLQTNGEVDVIEKHTYVFDGKFNGITREIIPKKGAKIDRFTASENGKALAVESKKGLYKIHRKGKDETVTIELHYQIQNGMEKYEDGAQFYWPFFDNRNEADYGNMKITIHPPQAVNKALFIGYDTAYDKGVLTSDGSVMFLMGEVPAGKNGDIRVVYEPKLFPKMAESNGTIRSKVIEESNRLAEEERRYAANKEQVAVVGGIGITAVGILLVALFSSVSVVGRRKRQAIRDKIQRTGVIIPEQKMSIPATIFFTKAGQLTPETTAAALLDLIRKGHIKQLTEQQFELVNRDVTHSHEQVLIALLFDRIGDRTYFDIADLETYTKKETNHHSYSLALASWRKAIAEEVKSQDLFENRAKFRWMIAFLAVVVGVVAIPFAWYELFLYMALAIVFALTMGGFAALYHPKNKRGIQIVEEWKQFRAIFKELNMEEWNRLPMVDKLRAYTYGIGMKDQNLGTAFKEFADAENRMRRGNVGSPIVYNPVDISSSFNNANTNASIDASGSSTTSSSSGGGTGGGGGGSGAF